MYKLNSLLFYVANVPQSVIFYRALGFGIPREEKDIFVAKLGEFEIHGHDQTTVQFPQDPNVPKGAGVFVYVNVDKIDEYHRSLLDKGLKPSSEPHNWAWGNREFAIRDPDGYVLVFYQPLKTS